MSKVDKNDQLLKLLKLYNSYTAIPYELIRSEGYDAWQRNETEDTNPYLIYKHYYIVWREGYIAGSNLITQNPYPENSDDHKIWQEGSSGNKGKKINPYAKSVSLYKAWQEGWWDGQHQFDSVAAIYQKTSKTDDPRSSKPIGRQKPFS